MKKVMRWFEWITNNESTPRHEVEFDIGFFIVNTIALIVGCYYIYTRGEVQWIAFLIIEYNWALDNMRHNR